MSTSTRQLMSTGYVGIWKLGLSCIFMDKSCKTWADWGSSPENTRIPMGQHDKKGEKWQEENTVSDGPLRRQDCTIYHLFPFSTRPCDPLWRSQEARPMRKGSGQMGQRLLIQGILFQWYGLRRSKTELAVQSSQICGICSWLDEDDALHEPLMLHSLKPIMMMCIPTTNKYQEVLDRASREIFRYFDLQTTKGYHRNSFLLCSTEYSVQDHTEWWEMTAEFKKKQDTEYSRTTCWLN